MKLAVLGALAALMIGPAIASADYRYDRGARYDRGERYYGRGGHSFGHHGHHSHGSRSGFNFSIGFGSSRYHGDHSYARFGYSSRPHYYAPTARYYAPPVYYSRPVYVAPAPVYVAPPVYYHSTSYYGSGYGRPRHYYYSTGSYYHCR